MKKIIFLIFLFSFVILNVYSQNIQIESITNRGTSLLNNPVPNTFRLMHNNSQGNPVYNDGAGVWVVSNNGIITYAEFEVQVSIKTVDESFTISGLITDYFKNNDWELLGGIFYDNGGFQMYWKNGIRVVIEQIFFPEIKISVNFYEGTNDPL